MKTAHNRTTSPEDYKQVYKAQIIEMIEAQEDALLLQQIYTILIRRKRKAGA